MVDWLSVTVEVLNFDNNEKIKELVEKLEIEKAYAQRNIKNQSGDKALIEIGGEDFEVKSVGTASYSYILHNAFLELRISKERSRNKDTYPVYVHFKSEFLWSNGPENCWIWFKEWFEKSLGKISTNKINRADLCLHTDLAIEMNPHYFEGRFTENDIKCSNRKITGITFGSRSTQKIYCRIYNKTEEIKKSKKYWFKDIWIEHGLNPDSITNIEFELHRNFLKEIPIRDNLFESRFMETIEDLFDNIRPIWKYCTEDWLELTRTSQKGIDNGINKNIWSKVQTAFDNFKGEGKITRKKQKLRQTQQLIAGGMGHITSFAALRGITDQALALKYFVLEGNKMLDRKGKNFKKVVEKKKKLLDKDKKKPLVDLKIAKELPKSLVINLVRTYDSKRWLREKSLY